jgi:hypothetical protein
MPSEVLPAIGTCVVCGGNSIGCQECDGTGTFKITDCPQRWIDEWVWQMIELADLYEKGLPPLAGGVLDQAAYFVRFAKRVMDESAQYKMEF